MKRCAVCGEIVADDVMECPVCHAKKFVPSEEAKFACEPQVGAGVGEDEARHGAGFKGLLKRYFN